MTNMCLTGDRDQLVTGDCDRLVLTGDCDQLVLTGDSDQLCANWRL